ncbi:MAG: SUMF1/EgtB/PvdO family nonheme iron enzyme [Planctomycetota bacterium]
MKLIPEGEFQMGDHSGAGWLEELPVHTVYIDSFSMDTSEVTDEEYCKFLNSARKQGLIELSSGVVYKKNSSSPYCDTTLSSSYSRITWNGYAFGITANKRNHPMVMVSWYGAVAYANWRSAQEGLIPCYDLETWQCDFDLDGYRLPTEAEWEKAARGGEHSPYYDYPWGNTVDGSKANFKNSGDPYEGGPYPWTAPVRYYDGNQTPPGVDMANGYGLYDMAGTVWEWCNDWCDHSYYQFCVDNNIYNNPTGPSSSPFGGRVLRGGSWFLDEFSIRCSFRHSNDLPGFRSNYSGFRLVTQ